MDFDHADVYRRPLSGSTGGGIKVSRVIITIKAVCRELRTYIHPKSIQNVKIDDKQVSPEIIRSINVYLITLVIMLCDVRVFDFVRRV